MMDQKFTYLFLRHIEKTISSEERAELLELMSEPVHDIEFQELIKKIAEDPGLETPLPEENARAILQTILQTERVQPAKLIKLSQKGHWRKWVAAAAIFLLLAGGYGIWRLQKGRVAVVAGVQGQDIPAGQSGALLTMSNGKTVLLDSIRDGTIATQGSSRIVKQGGQVTYKTGSSTASAGIVYNTISTLGGRTFQLQLADGSRLWLNARSSVTYPTAFNGTDRRITITGEVYIEVQADKSKPFLVDIPGREAIEVLGTHFNVNAYADEPRINTTLIEGAVRVSTMGMKKLAAVVLQPGQQAQLDEESLIINNSVNIEEVMAWKNGYFAFAGATTEEIMRQVARWYDAKIVYEGDVRNERFSGMVPRTANAFKLLEVLSLTKTVQFTIEDKKIIVRPFHP